MVVRRLRQAMLIVSAAALVLASSMLPAVAAGPTGWRVQTTIMMKGKVVALTEVAADARNDAWAIGYWVKGEEGPVPLVEHWNGSSWRRVVLPGSAVTALSADGPLDAVGASSPRNVWGFGLVGEWLHWNGARWTFGRLPRSSLTVRVDSALVLGARNVWAFGFRLRSDGALQYAAHFNGAKWVTVRVPNAHEIVAASAVSLSDIWVLSGFSPIEGGEPGSLAHWSGGKWRSVPVPKALSSSLRSIVARSDSDVWVGGAVASAQKGGTEAVGHWNGHRWTVTPMPTRVSAHGFLQISAMAPDGSGGLWAIAGSSFEAVTPRLWRYARGRWRQSSLRPLDGSPPASMVYVPHSRSIWGVGSINGAGLIALAGPLPRSA